VCVCTVQLALYGHIPRLLSLSWPLLPSVLSSHSSPGAFDVLWAVTAHRRTKDKEEGKCQRKMAGCEQGTEEGGGERGKLNGWDRASHVRMNLQNTWLYTAIWHVQQSISYTPGHAPSAISEGTTISNCARQRRIFPALLHSQHFFLPYPVWHYNPTTPRHLLGFW